MQAARSSKRNGGGDGSGERFDVVVIGGGQAGLSVGYHLRERGLRFVILDAGARVGDAWRNRWDSLRLFTPAKLSSLDGMRFPAPGDYFPTKDEMGDYLEAYAARFALPVRTGARVQRLSRRDGGGPGAGGPYVVTLADGAELHADQVVVAMSNYQEPRVPAFAAELRAGVGQLHSTQYRSPDQLRPGGVLLVGAGNSGAEIAHELARGAAGRHRPVFVAGRDTGQVPFDIDGAAGRLLERLLLRFVFHRVLTVRTPMGRKARAKSLAKGTPLIRLKRHDLTDAGVERVGRVAGVRDGLPVLADGRVLDVANVVWCTGFHPGFSWIDLPVVGPDGEPAHDAGVVPAAPGLYFVGLHFLYAMSSPMIHGVGRDARRIAGAVVAFSRARRRRPAEARAAEPHDRLRRSTKPTQPDAPGAAV